MLITKTLNNITFGWDQSAFNGKGYWYVMGKNSSFARAATRDEAQRLGNPSPKETEPISPKVYKEKSIDYQKAREMKKKSLKDLIADRILSGESIGKSIRGSISDKFKARATRTKEIFDPLNILSAMTGRSRLGTAVAARILGRSANDARYFMGDRTKTSTSAKQTRERTIAKKLSYDKLTEPKIKSNYNEKTLLKIENVLVKQMQYQKKHDEFKTSFENIEKRKDEVRHEKLLNAILSLSKIQPNDVKTGKKKGNGIFGFLLSLLGAYEFVKNFLKKKLKGLFFDTVKGIGKRFLKWGKGLWDFLGEKIGWIGKRIKDVVFKIWDGISDVATKLWKGVTDMFSKVFGLFEKIPGMKKLVEGIKNFIPDSIKGLGEDASKFGGKAVRVVVKGAKSIGETASKMGSKVLRGAEAMGEFFDKLKPIAKALPGADVLFAVGLIADEIYNAIGKYRSGKIDAMGLEKLVIKAIAGVLGGTAGAEAGAAIGGALGSVVPVVGNLIGALVGGVAGWGAGEWAGDKIGKYVFDFFKNAGNNISADISKTQKYFKIIESKMSASKIGSYTKSNNKTSNPKIETNKGRFASGVITSAPAPKPMTKPNPTIAKAASMVNQNASMRNSKTSRGKPTIINKTSNVNTETNDDSHTLSGGASVRDNSLENITAKNYERAFGI